MKALKDYLRDSSISQTDFAKSVGVSQPTVWEWLNGRSSPSIENLKRISAKTGISVDELIRDLAA